MPKFNFSERLAECKLVYYGPSVSGKTTNLQQVHKLSPKESISDLVSIATADDRTIYFDYLGLDLGQIAGMQTKLQLYTVPGQVFYDSTRRLVLQGADAVVFVADSSPDRMGENMESLENLAKNLAENGMDIHEVPLVMQWNKRDLINATEVPVLEQLLNPYNAPSHEAIAIQGTGVFETLKIAAGLMVNKVNQMLGYETDGQTRLGPARPAAGSAAPAASPGPAVKTLASAKPAAPAAKGATPIIPDEPLELAVVPGSPATPEAPLDVAFNDRGGGFGGPGRPGLGGASRTLGARGDWVPRDEYEALLKRCRDLEELNQRLQALHIETARRLRQVQEQRGIKPG